MGKLLNFLFFFFFWFELILQIHRNLFSFPKKEIIIRMKHLMIFYNLPSFKLFKIRK